MRLFTLTFPTEKNMRAFLDTLGSTFTEINFRTMTLICECSEDEADRAQKEYGATAEDLDQSILK